MNYGGRECKLVSFGTHKIVELESSHFLVLYLDS